MAEAGASRAVLRLTNTARCMWRPRHESRVVARTEKSKTKHSIESRFETTVNNILSYIEYLLRFVHRRQQFVRRIGRQRTRHCATLDHGARMMHQRITAHECVSRGMAAGCAVFTATRRIRCATAIAASADDDNLWLVYRVVLKSC